MNGQGTYTSENGNERKALWKGDEFLREESSLRQKQINTGDALRAEVAKKRLLETKKCNECDFSRANFKQAKFNNVNLRGG